MADYIFTSGTCLKSDLYNLIINSLTSAGWANVSSNPTTDFDVLTSTGEEGNKKLVIQLRPLPVAGTVAQSVITSDFNVASYRLINSYIPGNSGTAGTFGRATEAWSPLYLVPNTTQMSASTVVNYKLHVNKNRLIYVIEYPSPFGYNALTGYIGLPDVLYCSEPDSRGLVVALSAYGNTANSVHISDAVGEMPSGTTSTARAMYCTLSAKNPNSSNQYLISEIYYGNTSEGMRGKLTGVFALPNTNVNTGDVIKIGTKSYYVAVNQTASTNSFPSLALAFQIS